MADTPAPLPQPSFVGDRCALPAGDPIVAVERPQLSSADQAIGEKKLRRRKNDFLRPDIQQGPGVELRGVNEVRMEMHRALRTPGRARRIKPEADVVGEGWGGGRIMRLAANPVFESQRSVGLAGYDGEVRLAGMPVTGSAPFRIACLGVAYVPEGRGVFPNLSVGENLSMAARGAAGGRGSWTLARVLKMFPRLAERLPHPESQLSGGEQQMLVIGRAL